MIRYSLACDAGHRFDSWFGDSSAFDELAARRLVSCPTCASTEVSKTIMAPAVRARQAVSGDGAISARSSADVGGSVEVSLLDDGRKELRNLIKAFREKIIAETHDVGARFPIEARQMHNGEIPLREIRGQASIDEARTLLEDGIMILPLPVVPDEFN